MTRTILNRILQGIITLLILVSFIFILARLIGDPTVSLLEPDASQAEREELIHRLGLDQPLYVQYEKYMGNLLKGDLGESLKFNKPVIELFFDRFPNTIKLAGVSFAIAMIFGFIFGVLQATHRGTFIDRILGGISVIGMSAPNFWVGLMLMMLFSARLGLLPVAGMESPSSYVLPSLTLSLFSLAGTTRLTRSSMIEVLDSEFIKLAQIKGVSSIAVLWKHSFRNALLPIFTFAGIRLAFLLSGSVVVESVFAWPGVGRLLYQGIVGRDYPLVQGCLLIIGAMIVVINLVVDISYSYLDPRVRLGKGEL
jgi:peptide/nickel transport system permease protein